MVDEIFHAGSLRVEVVARRTDALFEELLLGALHVVFGLRASRHGTSRRHSVVLFILATEFVVQKVGGAFVGARQPRSEHHVAGSRSQGQCNVTGMANTTVSPNVPTRGASGRGAFHHGGELGSAHTRHHAGGAHGSGTHAYFDNVCPTIEKFSRAVSGDDVTGHDGGRGSGRAREANGFNHLSLMAMRGVDHDGVNAKFHQARGTTGDVAIDSYRHRHVQSTLIVGVGPINSGSYTTSRGHYAHEAALLVNDWGHT